MSWQQPSRRLHQKRVSESPTWFHSDPWGLAFKRDDCKNRFRPRVKCGKDFGLPFPKGNPQVGKTRPHIVVSHPYSLFHRKAFPHGLLPFFRRHGRRQCPFANSVAPYPDGPLLTAPCPKLYALLINRQCFPITVFQVFEFVAFRSKMVGVPTHPWARLSTMIFVLAGYYFLKCAIVPSGMTYTKKETALSLRAAL